MDQAKDNKTDGSLIHDFAGGKKGMATPRLVVLFLAVVLLGVGTGYLMANNSGTGGLSGVGNSLKSATLSKGKIIGSDDLKTYKDTAEGILKEGGIEGEGQYHLERPGGESQNVYLTSFTVDLGQFKNKKIKVWGQTQKAQTAGWLMDVGRVQVL